MNLDSFFKKTIKYEPYFFFILVILYTIPILSFQFFLTVDGPAHVYNSTLITELWNADSPVHHFLTFNETLTPNWLGHLLLSLLTTFLPSFIAEKIVLLIYVVGLPVGIRYLFNSIGIKNTYLIYFIFPFTYSYLFYFGFFNFNIGVVLFLFGIGLWIRKRKNITIGNFVKLSLMASLICLSHLFVFALFLMVIFFINLEDLVMLFRTNWNNRIELLKSFLFQFGCLPIGIIIVFLFLASDNPLMAPTEYLSFGDLFTSFKYIMPAKGINYTEYAPIVKPMLYVFAGLIFWIGIRNIISLFRKREILIANKTWLIICLTTLILGFLLPNRIGAAGFISARLILFFFVFLIIWLASQPMTDWIKAIVIITITVVNIIVINHNYNSQSYSNNFISELRSISHNIKDYSTVLPITYSDNPMYAHVSNYLGVEKPIILLENYEVALNQFPLVWNMDNLPSLKFGNMDPNECFSWPMPVASKNSQLIEYVCVINDRKITANDSCYKSLQSTLDIHYNLIDSTTNNRIKLYEVKLPLTKNKPH